MQRRYAAGRWYNRSHGRRAWKSYRLIANNIDCLHAPSWLSLCSVYDCRAPGAIPWQTLLTLLGLRVVRGKLTMEASRRLIYE